MKNQCNDEVSQISSLHDKSRQPIRKVNTNFTHVCSRQKQFDQEHHQNVEPIGRNQHGNYIHNNTDDNIDNDSYERSTF